MPFNEFHYTPTGTGVISGKEVLEQTEDAINDLGNQISGDVQTAIDTANNALNVANTASVDAQNAVNTANTAHTAATNAQNTANAAQGTATSAQNAATAAQNDVDALETVVTGIDGRLTTTEGNVTNLTTRMGTAEGNITTLKNDVVTAQGTATSAQNTATLARGQAYVVRYASVAVSDNSTVPYTDLNNTDNIKANDLLLDTNGKLYQISSVDTANETVSVTTPLTRLALDSNVIHTSGNETSTGFKTFENIRLTNSIRAIALDDETVDINNCYSSFASPNSPRNGNIALYSCNTDVSVANISNLPEQKAFYLISITIRYLSNTPTVKQILITRENVRYERFCTGGTWSNWQKDTDKYVTTDTNQTIAGTKDFTQTLRMYNTDTAATPPQLHLRNSKVSRGSTTEIGAQNLLFADKTGKALGIIESRVSSNGNTSFTLQAYNVNANNETIIGGVQIIQTPSQTQISPTTDNAVENGRSNYRWSNTSTILINGLTPSSLSMPASSGTVDISGYVTDLTGVNVNNYTPVANGYIVITCYSSDVEYIKMSNNLDFVSVVDNTSNQFTSGLLGVWQPCVAGIGVQVRIKSNALNSARFIPCQGNI